jgi:hypothetical protein
MIRTSVDHLIVPLPRISGAQGRHVSRDKRFHPMRAL